MWYQPRNILLDLTKIIIKRNLTDFYLEVLILSTMQIILEMVLEKKAYIKNIHFENPAHKKF